MNSTPTVFLLVFSVKERPGPYCHCGPFGSAHCFAGSRFDASRAVPGAQTPPFCSRGCPCPLRSGPGTLDLEFGFRERAALSRRDWAPDPRRALYYTEFDLVLLIHEEYVRPPAPGSQPQDSAQVCLVPPAVPPAPRSSECPSVRNSQIRDPCPSPPLSPSARVCSSLNRRSGAMTLTIPSTDSSSTLWPCCSLAL